MTKEEAIECLVAISKIEGYTMSYEGLNRTGVLYDNIDIIVEKLRKVINNS